MTRHDQGQCTCTQPVMHHEYMTSSRQTADLHVQALALRHFAAATVQQRPGDLVALRSQRSVNPELFRAGADKVGEEPPCLPAFMP